jgi:hypothetical protein
VFLVVDEDGSEFIVKVDSWEDGVTDPTAPEAQYAAVEAFLAEQGINATVVDHAIKAGSYQGNSGGGIFLSDGSRVPQSDIDDYWFGEAWTGKAFNGPNVDFEVDFDDLPAADRFGDEDPRAKALDADDAEGDHAPGNLSDQSDSEADSDDSSDTDTITEPDEDDSLSSLADPGVESIDLFYPDESESEASISGEMTTETQVDFDFDDRDSDMSGELVDALEAGDLISEEDDLQGLLSDGDAPEPDASVEGSQFGSISLEENFKLDLDDGDNGESFD